eukprot:CAMPEP_0198276144 /NCGR_PEP_ID=MMETSP1447-20131203/65152_1 /TAXON_ID=420782 /ORGANISM="Chaetoceros dichaeta, Strain CCMP1751" /LENGTH=58 /DNA_ID=CAMNT_0043971065 /DNA_START=302 /DNA_END=478 /DNA_ORIENTATION=+
MVVNLTHPSNVLGEIEMRFSGKRTEVNDEHLLKAKSPMVLIFDGSVIDANDEHPLKAL